ncbi:MAG: Xylose isomerase domain protein barrel [Pedosphaera sp.]|nr:Xylose isomerase domain protein barrel [Pedosphaera sp.]
MNATKQLLSRLAFASVWFTLTAALHAAPIPDDCKVGDFVLGSQAWTFNHFTVFEAIEKTALTGGKTIEFFPGQKLSLEQPEIKWDHNASDEIIQKVKDQLAKNHIRAVNYGVVYPKGGAEEWRKIFEFAKKMELYGITTESVQDLDIIEPLVKEFDIKVGIHEHYKRPEDPSYKVWDPNYVLSVVKDRDPRIGACADTGHWATSGFTPLDCVKLLHGRIISVHLKERKAIGTQLPDCVYGTGVSNIKGILDELKRQGFTGNISIEYENHWDYSVPEVAQCVGFVRGYNTRPTP